MAGDNTPPADDPVVEQTYEDLEKFEDFDEVDAESVTFEEDDFDESVADYEGEH